MNPGIYPDLPAADYHAIDACSATRLKWMSRSPAYCRWRIDHNKSTSAMTLGTAAHMAVLEPDRFLQTCARRPERDGKMLAVNTKDYKGWLQAIPPGSIPLPPQDYDAAVRMRDAVWDCPEAVALLKGHYDYEASMFWTDAATGLPCKCRVDVLGCALTDLKTTAKLPGPGAVNRWVASEQHHLQGAFYRNGAAHTVTPRDNFALIVVRSDPPHECAVFDLDPDALRCGAERVRRLMDTYAACVESGEWPGWAGGIHTASVPEWEQRECWPEEYAPIVLTRGGKKLEGI